MVIDERGDGAGDQTDAEPKGVFANVEINVAVTVSGKSAGAEKDHDANGEQSQDSKKEEIGALAMHSDLEVVAACNLIGPRAGLRGARAPCPLCHAPRGTLSARGELFGEAPKRAGWAPALRKTPASVARSLRPSIICSSCSWNKSSRSFHQSDLCLEFSVRFGMCSFWPICNLLGSSIWLSWRSAS
jgi:hypothetical protein